MNKVGLCIPKGIIVSITNNVEERRIITSDMEHYVRYSTNYLEMAQQRTCATVGSGIILANITTR
jgi:hypothetical protein